MYIKKVDYKTFDGMERVNGRRRKVKIRKGYTEHEKWTKLRMMSGDFRNYNYMSKSLLLDSRTLPLLEFHCVDFSWGYPKVRSIGLDPISTPEDLNRVCVSQSTRKTHLLVERVSFTTDDPRLT